jgi:hypothetical protein
MADMHASELAIQGAVVQGTNAKQSPARFCYREYLSSIGLSHDCFLDEFSPCQKQCIHSAFAHAIREGRFGSSRNRKTNKSKSVRATLDCMA